MASDKPLHAVKPGEKLATNTKRKQSVSQAAATGDHRALLVAMRDRISKTVSDPDCPPRDLASLTRRLQDIAKDIEAIDARDAEEAQHHDASEAEDGEFDSSAV